MEDELENMVKDCENRGKRKLPESSHQEKYIKSNVYNPFSNRLMLSTSRNMLPDRMQDWILVPCPKGVRCLLLSSHYTTKCFKINGEFFCEFQSCLPGGSKNCPPNQYCILDCILSEKTNCFYVLDVLAWTNIDMRKQESQMRYILFDLRFFWIHSNIPTGAGQYRFQPMNHIDSLHFLDADFDGVLLFEKSSIYKAGVSEDVLWFNRDHFNSLLRK